MYIPDHFAGDDQDAAWRLVADYPFAVLISPGEETDISHLPLIRIAGEDGSDRIIGHVARANPHWHRFDGKTPAITIFTGPHAYVSPNWYDSAGMVPTWNYSSVHVHGRPVVIDDAAGAEAVLRRLIAAFETDATGNWSLDRLTPTRIAQQLKGIVAFEIPIESVHTKFKMSQNRNPADVAGVIEQLSQSPYDADRQTAEMMRAIEKR